MVQDDFVSAIRNHANIAFNQSNDPDSHPDTLAPEAKKLQDLRKEATFSVNAAAAATGGNGNSSSTSPAFQPAMLGKMLL